MLTVSHLIDSFYADYVVRVKTGQSSIKTLDWYKAALEKLRSAAGKYPADALRVHHLVNVEFTNHFVRSIKALYKWAADDDVQLVPHSPFRKLIAPTAGQRDRTLTRPEMTRLYRASSPAYRRLWFVAAHTMARPGELRQLRWRDVHFERRCITLNQFKAKDKRKDGVKVRTIPLDAMVLRMLQNWFRQREPRPHGRVFCNRFGDEMTSNAIRCAMRRVRAKAGLEPEDEVGERVVCYTLRHTGATEATRRGVRDRELADILGHTTTRTTARYQHLNPDDLVNAIDRMRSRKREQ
ncbi:MAG: site-specific integrase [Bacteroidales bacterium]|nr:site-specific integrase [Bacteroidales bacterium]